VTCDCSCKISNTIICNNAYLKSNCVVDKSAIGASYELENGCTYHLSNSLPPYFPD